MLNVYTFIWIGIAWLVLFFFAGIEMAFASANKLSIELKKKQGLKSGIILSRLLEKPAQFIGTAIIGFNLFLILFGLMVGETLQPFWNVLITKIHIPSGYVNAMRLLVETFISAFFIIVFGNVLPKALFRAKSDKLLHLFSSVANFFFDFFNPVLTFFIAISKWILKYLFNVRIEESTGTFSSSAVENFYQQTGEADEENKELNAELFEAALSLPKLKVRECFVPRKEIEGIDINATVEEARKKFISTKLSKLVVYDGNLDHVAGYIHQLDLFKNPATIQSILLPIPAVPESMGATDLINKFSRERKSIAWVVDEFGGTAGIVTMEDLLEEIFGEIKDEYDTEEFEEKKLSDTEFIFSGRLELDYLNAKYELSFPMEESETLSGYIINKHEAIPKQKERIIIGHYEFEILAVSDTRIEMVRIKILK
ncbi:MAG: HlyC/CorC family transporter [Bacteroidetes bacterium]|nr:HlyC/CorC family transporter [Bacteroidota bacterium]MBS1975542.1 HlyC/CorC family transporter [Bacteroidota bacterium]